MGTRPTENEDGFQMKFSDGLSWQDCKRRMEEFLRSRGHPTLTPEEAKQRSILRQQARAKRREGKPA